MKRAFLGVNGLRRWQSWIAPFLLLFLLGLTGGNVSAASRTVSATGAQVTVHVGQVLSSISPLAVGVNDAVWDSNLSDPQVPGLLAAAGVKVMRFPGGSTADMYHWQTNTLDNGTSAGTETFDDFMKIVQQVGATPIITVNYGTGTPQEAAAWVQYANVTKHYHIKYWEIGNELYGNGTYGADWENDNHAQGPATYASNSLQFIQAMKAVDPGIQTGLVLTAPGNWPDGQTSATSPLPWNDTVLPAACSAANFVVVHWYPQGPTGESDASLLASPANGESTSVSFTPSIPSMVSSLHTEINQYCGSHASAVQVMATETNSVSYNPGKQTTNLVNALFLTENFMTWLSNGVTNVDWWDVHNNILTGDNNSPTLYGDNQFGDYGLLSNGGSSDGVSEPPAETPFPDYYGLQMVSKLVGQNFLGLDKIVGATSDQSLVTTFAVLRPDGTLAVLLVNTDPSNSYSVKLNVPFTASLFGATTYSYGQSSTALSVSHESGKAATTQVVAPYSLTTVVFRLL